MLGFFVREASLKRRRPLFGAALGCVLVAAACGGSTVTIPDSDGGGQSGGDGGGPSGDGGGTSSDGGGGTSGDGSALDASACRSADGGVPEGETGCTNSESCVAVLLAPCCGPQYAVGVNHAFRDAFLACESAVEAACGARGCASGPIEAQDGKTGQFDQVQVSCDNGTCRTHF